MNYKCEFSDECDISICDHINFHNASEHCEEHCSVYDCVPTCENIRKDKLEKLLDCIITFWPI